MKFLERREMRDIYSWHSSLLVQIWFPCTVIVSVKSKSYTEPHFLDYQKKNLILIKKRKKPSAKKKEKEKNHIYLFIFFVYLKSRSRITIQGLKSVQQVLITFS